jgi:SAM-dependent methyltransferase
MRNDLLKILACPFCADDNDLILNTQDKKDEIIVKGYFKCCICKRHYLIENDIPYFGLEISHKGVKNQFKTYSEWWNTYHGESVVIDPQNPEYFFNSLQIEPDKYKNKIVLDAGCGNGRFSYVISRYSPKLHIAFDISSGIKHAQSIILKNNPNAPIAFVQGDITRPPFKKSCFDIVFSWGVIHHTPNTRLTFSGLAKLVKNQGVFGLYVYEFHPYYAYDKQLLMLLALLRSNLVVLPLRFVLSRLPSFCAKLFFLPVFLFQKITGNGFLGWFFGINLAGKYSLPAKRFFSVVMDRYKTRYATEHTFEEVLNWFNENGFNDIKVGSYPAVSLHGIKSGQSKTQSVVINKK